MGPIAVLTVIWALGPYWGLAGLTGA